MDAEHHIVPKLAARGGLVMSEPELIAWGERFGAEAHAPLVVTLTGELGAGKTTLAQAICRGYGVTSPVTSPTYALVHEYASPRTPVFHIDLYRLNSPDDLTQLGWDDLVRERALVLIEWPERAGARIPEEHVPITLDYDPDDASARILLAG